MPATIATADESDALLREVVRLFIQAERALTSGCCDATSKECEALRLITQQEDLTVQGFAAQMGLEKTWASRLLVRMERDGLIKRVPNPSDQRSLLVRLTAKGRSEQRKLAETQREQALALMGCVPASERENVTRALAHLRTALAHCLEKCGSGSGRC